MEQGAPLSHHWGSSLQTLSGDWGEETIWIQYLKQANFSSVLLDCTSQLSNSSETVWPTSCLELLYRYKLFFFLSTVASRCIFYLLFVCYLCQSISLLDTSFPRSQSPFTRAFIAWQQEFNMRWFPCSRGCLCSLTALQAPEWRCLGAACCLSSTVSFLIPEETEGETKCKGWHFWRSKDLHFASSGRCSVSVRMQQWLIFLCHSSFMLPNRTTRNPDWAICKQCFVC